MRVTRWAPLVTVILFGATGAQAEEVTAAGQRVVAVLGFDANPAAKEQVAAVQALVASQLADAKDLRVISQADLATMLDVERQRKLLGVECTESCMSELAGAIGARYVLSGRADRFGDAWVLTATLFDSHEARALTKAHSEAETEADLPEAARRLSGEVVGALGVPSAQRGLGTAKRGGVTLGLKMGNSFLIGLTAFSLTTDLEIGYRFEPDWVGFIQLGFTWVPRTEIVSQSFGVLPSVVGVRHLYRLDASFQPYWGLGLGVQLALDGKFGFVRDTGPLPMVLGFGGFQYMITERFGVGLEASTNIAQPIVGLINGGSEGGLNFDANATLGWRF